MNSFGILRTNVGLTTNVKIVIDTKYKMSLDSIDSNEVLSSDRYKNFKFNKDNYYEDLIPRFYKNTPVDLSFQIKYDNDIDTMSDNFSSQNDDIYNYGARNIINNKNYKEEYEYFAPLYINKNKLPSDFVIFRVDGPGLENISRENFKLSIINKLKFVKIFDLSIESELGQWLDRSFVSNKYFPDTPIEIDFRPLQFSKWNGIDYETGGYSSKSVFLNPILEEEKEIFELEKTIFDVWKNNKIVFPNILNLSFLFDDNPSTPELKRKWSINRYFGFYINKLELITSISPYKTKKLRQDVEIQEGNILYSTSNPDNPFVEDWSENEPFYIEYKNDYYLVKRFDEKRDEVIKQTQDDGFINEEYQRAIFKNYKIMSDVDLTDKQSQINNNYGFIDEDGKLMIDELVSFQIADFDKADVWLIEIDGIFHNLIRLGNGDIKVNTDYSFKLNKNSFEYKVNSISTIISLLVDFNNKPIKFNIYRIDFTDIKDFDTRIVDTEYSKYEYEKEEEITETDETKMYFENPLSNTNPKEVDDFVYKSQVLNIPVSSEYTSNYETFKIVDGDLSDIWRINPVYCRWVFQNSLSANDYPYLLNNSLVFEQHNRTVNPFEESTDRTERNLDYFYTINSSTSSYLHHSLHIEDFKDYPICDEYLIEFYTGCTNSITYTSCEKNNIVSISPQEKGFLSQWPNGYTFSICSSTTPSSVCFDTTSATFSQIGLCKNGCELEFDINEYLKADYDYFTNLFDRRSDFNDFKLVKNIKKHSYFNRGDSSVPNITLFRGIEFRVYDVESISLNDTNQIDNIEVLNSNKFEDYKFSIILTSGDSNLEWTIIEEWKLDNNYQTGSTVLFDDILYTNLIDTTETRPYIGLTVGTEQVEISASPYTTVGWTPSSIPFNILWDPNGVYIDNNTGTASFVYNNDNFYECIDDGSTIDFWNPIKSVQTGYGTNEVVIYRDKYWISMTSSNWVKPGTDIKRNKNREFLKIQGNNYVYWEPVSISQVPKWLKIQIWSSNFQYLIKTYVIHNEILYISISNVETGEEPGSSAFWRRVYNIRPDSTYVYKPNDNPIIINNNRYYLIDNNPSDETLNNGINVFINKKWKNVLINIYINDNTLPNIKNTDRDLLYTDLYNKLTAYNFINCINNLSNKGDFSNFLKYTILEDGGVYKTYQFDNNFKNLPCIVSCEFPDSLLVKVNSLVKTPINIKLNTSIKLINGNISNISELNYYNNIPVAYLVDRNKKPTKFFKNYNDNKNIEYVEIYRFSGYYMPLFYDIQLFSRSCRDKNVGNYIFDTSLTNFGICIEHKIKKVNRSGSILKLKDSTTEKSIYPMINEFGYTYKNFMIFKSTWDNEYHTETVDNKPRLVTETEQQPISPLNIGLPTDVKVKNSKKYNL